jgi:hypothetical protein
MSTLLVTLPNATQVVLKVADNTLVFDGHDFVEPSEAEYVMLYSVDVAALSLPFVEASITMTTKAYIKAGIVAYDAISVTPTSTSVVAEPDPSLGQCICFVTCTGTVLRYVRVIIDPS